MLKTTQNCFFFLSIIFLNSCALKPQRHGSISSQINNFKDDTQRKKLKNIIEERPQAQVLFLKDKSHATIDKWVHYFSKKDKARFQRYLKNGSKYKNLIEDTFARYNLPKDLFYVGLIESGYYLKAKSTASAVGPWQFIRATGKRYGLKISRSVDERRNIVKATEAAAKYFQDLHNIFGSWELALSAYNAGEYGVIRRIRGANTRDYYKLINQKKLPKETRNYVPKVIAAMTVAKNPEQYGLTVNQRVPSLFSNTASIKLYKSYKIRDLSKKFNVSYSTIKKLNNDLNWATTPRYKKSFELIIPANKNSQLDRKIASLSPVTKPLRTYKKLTRRVTHRVRSGDNLIKIAKKYRVYVKDIRRLNRLTSNKIRIGQKLKISSSKLKNNKRRKLITNYYKVKKGDFLIKIAKKFKTSTAKLRKLNGSSLKRIYPGQKIKISGQLSKFHTVKKGDFLLKIAKSYKISLSQLRKLNNKNINKIYPGQKIRISYN